MIRLCGTPISNYYNKVKIALLEKDIPFEEVILPPSQDESMLVRSPMGKVPFIEVDGACLSESQAIVEYLEEAYPVSPLYPSDRWARAKVRELIQILDLYIDWPGRPLIGAVFFGASVSDETKGNAWTAWERGVRALNRLAKFSPFIAGGQLSHADCAAFTHLRLAGVLSDAVYGKNILDTIPGAAAYLDTLQRRPCFERATADQNRALQAMMASRKGREGR